MWTEARCSERASTVERVNPPELARPRGFSHAVVGHGARSCSWPGRPRWTPQGRIVGADVVAQFEQALSNLLAALRAAGGRPDQLASLTVYATTWRRTGPGPPRSARVWRRLVGTDYPAMAGIGVARLWDDEALVEVQGFAVV